MMRGVMVMRGACRALCVMCVVGAAEQAWAQCETQELSVGVSVEVCEDGGVRHAIAAVDLAAGDVALRVSRSSERGRTPREWGESVDGAVLVVPAGAFAFPSFTPAGLTVGGGEPWSETRDDGEQAVLGFDARGVGVFLPGEQVVPAEPWQDTVVSGLPLVRDGVALAPCVGPGCEARPRTGMGLTADGRRLVIVVAERVTDPELGELLVGGGAWDGLRTGSGATSSLWTPGDPEWLIASSDGAAREAAAHLAVVDRASGEQFRLRGVVGVLGEDRFLSDAQVTVETLGGTGVASGMPITEGGYWEFRLPVREYLVRASRSGFRTGCKICVGVPAEDIWCSLFLEEGSGAESCSPPPRTLEVGPYPVAGEIPDAGVDAGHRMPLEPGGCAVGGGSPAWPSIPPLALVLLVLRRRRRR